MTMSPLRFWGSAVATAAALSALLALVPRIEILQATTTEERVRVWLLCVFIAGVFTILFALSARLGAFRGLGAGDVIGAGGFEEAVREMKERRAEEEKSPHFQTVDGWMIGVGATLVAIYFAGWLALT